MSEFEAKGAKAKAERWEEPKRKPNKPKEIPTPIQPKQGRYIEIVCVVIVIFVVNHCVTLNDYKNDYDYTLEIRCIVIVISVVVQSDAMNDYKNDYDYAFVYAHIK